MNYFQQKSSRIVHTGYMLCMENLSEEDQLKFKPFLEYTPIKKKKGETVSEEVKYMQMKKEPYVAMEYSRNSVDVQQNSVNIWFNKKKGTESIMYVKHIYSEPDLKIVVIEGHVDTKNCWITLHGDSQFTPIVIKKMVASGRLGKKHEFVMKIACKTYGWSEKNKFIY